MFKLLYASDVMLMWSVRLCYSRLWLVDLCTMNVFNRLQSLLHKPLHMDTRTVQGGSQQNSHTTAEWGFHFRHSSTCSSCPQGTDRSWVVASPYTVGPKYFTPPSTQIQCPDRKASHPLSARLNVGDWMRSLTPILCRSDKLIQVRTGIIHLFVTTV